MLEPLLISHLPGAEAKAPDLPAQSHGGTEDSPLQRTGRPTETPGESGEQRGNKKRQREHSRPRGASVLLSCLTALSRASISNQFNIAPIFLSIATHFVPTVSISLSRSLLTRLPATLPDTCHCHPRPPQSHDLEKEISLVLHDTPASRLPSPGNQTPMLCGCPWSPPGAGRLLSTLGCPPPNSPVRDVPSTLVPAFSLQDPSTRCPLGLDVSELKS